MPRYRVSDDVRTSGANDWDIVTGSNATTTATLMDPRLDGSQIPTASLRWKSVAILEALSSS